MLDPSDVVEPLKDVGKWGWVDLGLGAWGLGGRIQWIWGS